MLAVGRHCAKPPRKCDEHDEHPVGTADHQRAPAVARTGLFSRAEHRQRPLPIAFNPPRWLHPRPPRLEAGAVTVEVVDCRELAGLVLASAPNPVGDRIRSVLRRQTTLRIHFIPNALIDSVIATYLGVQTHSPLERKPELQRRMPSRLLTGLTEIRKRTSNPRWEIGQVGSGRVRRWGSCRCRRGSWGC